VVDQKIFFGWSELFLFLLTSKR